METPENSSLSNLQKRGSIKACIIESWKIFTSQVKIFFKFLWFHFFIAGLGFALFSAQMTWMYTEYVKPVTLCIESGIDPTMARTLFSPTLTSILVSLLALIACVVSTSLMMGAVFTDIRFYKATGSLIAAGPFTFWREVKQAALKVFCFDLIFGVATSLCIGLVALIAYWTHPLVLLLCIPVLLYAMVIGMNGRIQYTIENKKMKSALPSAFHTGHHKFGGFLILLILTGIPFTLLTYIAFLPISVFWLAQDANMVSQLAGDPSGIPDYVLPLYLLIATLAYFIYSFAYTLQQWPVALFTSAVCAKKKAQQAPATVKQEQ